MLLSASLLLALQSAEAPKYSQVSDEEITRRLEECEFKQIKVAYNRVLQSSEAIISDQTATEEQLACAAKAVDLTTHTAVFEARLMERYLEQVDKLTRPRIMAKMESNLAKRPELGPVPKREEGESDIELARRIEGFCGPEAKGAFAVRYTVLTFSEGWLSEHRPESDKSQETVECLFSAVYISGLPFGFIGNERYPVENEPEG